MWTIKSMDTCSHGGYVPVKSHHKPGRGHTCLNWPDPDVSGHLWSRCQKAQRPLFQRIISAGGQKWMCTPKRRSRPANTLPTVLADTVWWDSCSLSSHQKRPWKWNHMIGGYQVHTSRGFFFSEWKKKDRGTVAAQMERRAPFSREWSILHWISCEVLFSIRCIILKTHLTFQAELVWNSHIKRKKAHSRTRWLIIMSPCCVELKGFACLRRRNVWPV